jgi:hypothetical protein
MLNQSLDERGEAASSIEENKIENNFLVLENKRLTEMLMAASIDSPKAKPQPTFLIPAE